MTAADILADLASRGVTLSRRGEKLVVRGAGDVVTDDVIALLAEYKVPILDLLSARVSASSQPDAKAWTCQSPYCLHKGRWWRSVYGEVRCLNCHPPPFPGLVAETGDGLIRVNRPCDGRTP